MNKLKVLFGSLFILASLMFTAFSISIVPADPIPGCYARLVITPANPPVGTTTYFNGYTSECYSSAFAKVPISSYNFDFGDGTSVSGTSPTASHVYSSTGKYVVSLTVYSAQYQATTSRTIEVIAQAPQPPLPPGPNMAPMITSFGANPDRGNEPLLVTFTGSALDFDGDSMTYTLIYDMLNTRLNTSGSITRTSKVLGTYVYTAGLYTPKLIVSDGKLSVFALTTVIVHRIYPTPNEQPRACLSATPTSGVAPLKVLFNGGCSFDRDGTISSYLLKITKGPLLVNQQAGTGQPGIMEYTFTEAGDYNAELTVWDDDGASDHVSVTIRVSPQPGNLPPVACFTADRTSGYVPLSVVFNGACSVDPDGTIASYTWKISKDSAVIKSESGTGKPGTLGYTFTIAGNYSVTLTVVDNRGDSNSKTIFIDAKEQPQPENVPPYACFTANQTSGIEPLSVLFNGACSCDSDGTIASFSWKIKKDALEIRSETGTGSPGTLQHLFSAGQYVVTLFVWDNKGASNSTSTNINVYYQPPFPTEIRSFRAVPDSGTAPLTVNFFGSAAGPSALTYVLYFDTSNPAMNATGAITSTEVQLGTHIYTNGGTSGVFYTARLVVTSSAGSASRTIDIFVSPNVSVVNNTAPLVDFSYSPTDPYVGETVSFTDLSSDLDGTIASWLWNFGDGNTSTDQNPTHVYTENGTYTVSLTIYDNAGASNSTTKALTVLPGARPQPPEPVIMGGGGGGGLYIVQTPIPVKTSGISYFGFHPALALNGTREYSFDNTTNTTTITLKIVNLGRTNRTLSIRDVIPKDMAKDLTDVQIIPVPQTIYNQDPDIGWNVTLAPHQTFEARYIFKKYIPYSQFASMGLPTIREITKAGEIPVSPTTQVIEGAGGITGFMIFALSNPWVGLIILLVIIVIFFVFTETGRETAGKIKTKTSRFISSIAEELQEPEEPEEEESEERVKRLRKLVRAKPKKAKKRK